MWALSAKSEATRINIAGIQNKTVIILTVLIAMLNTMKQMKLIIDDPSIIAPPTFEYFMHKQLPMREITKHAKLTKGMVWMIISNVPPAIAPIRTKTNQNNNAQTAPIILEIKPIKNAGIDLFINLSPEFIVSFETKKVKNKSCQLRNLVT